MKMIARLAFLVFLSTECVVGTGLRENMTRISATEGMILSGGSGARTRVEVFVPSTGLSCSLPYLPDYRKGHIMDSLLICSGDDSPNGSTCLSLTSGQWITSHNLVERRDFGTSWQTEQGLVLMGGWSSYTSEIVATAGEQGGPSFAMQYSTEYACSMSDLTSDSVFITGGSDTMSTVSRYGVLGWVENLPSLLVGRFGHACGSFFRGDSQVILVAGGKDRNYNSLSSTEMLTMDSTSWALTTPLPRAVTGVRGVTLGGMFYITGGYGLRYGMLSERDEIIVWLDEEQKWEETGRMMMGSSYHAVTTIQMDDQAVEHCG